MSLVYDEYLKSHISNVSSAFNWILNNISISDISELFPDITINDISLQIRMHDASKYQSEEYSAYDRYFNTERTDKVKKMFDYAWLHHQHNNPHHWQYWILKEDDNTIVSENVIRVKALEIPDKYIMEMICDWWSFSWKKYKASHNKQDLYDIFIWYDDHKDGMVMHKNTIQKVETMLNFIRVSLDNQTDNIGIISTVV